jgi:MerR family transcriptional regulator/heat shock protein HspR
VGWDALTPAELAVVNTPWGEPGRGLFSISVAAELTGLHPQTLRLYDQEGLVSPGRSAGGTRRYSTDDIDRLHQIMALTSDGINLAGVRRILELQHETRLLQAEVDRLAAVARNRPDPNTRPAPPTRPERRDPPG